jgi:hypothetical protein
MRPNTGQALQLALFFTEASAVPIGNPGLPFEIYTALGHKLRFFRRREAQFMTVGIIY